MTYIPEMSKADITQIAENIKVIVGNYYIKKPNLFETAFIWSPTNHERVKRKKIESIQDIVTYHTFGYYGFFKPSIAEVIKQIPKEIRNSVAAFEIIEYPETAEDKHLKELNDGVHVAKTRLYRKKE